LGLLDLGLLDLLGQRQATLLRRTLLALALPRRGSRLGGLRGGLCVRGLVLHLRRPSGLSGLCSVCGLTFGSQLVELLQSLLEAFRVVFKLI
jgi:hypothetical protein